MLSGWYETESRSNVALSWASLVVQLNEIKTNENDIRWAEPFYMSATACHAKEQ